MSDLFKDTIPSILQTKKSVITEENEKDYVPFIVNKALSFHYDCIIQANEMNKNHSIDKLPQYHYLLNSIRKYKRPFRKWLKREEISDLEAVKEYYKYSNDKAKDAMLLLSPDQLEDIKRRINKGGINDKPKRIDRGKTTRTR